MLTLFLPVIAGFAPHYPPEVARSIQRWDLPTLREQVSSITVERLNVCATSLKTPRLTCNCRPRHSLCTNWQVRQNHVRKVAFYQDERLVEVLDTNGLQRSVQIFPEATPYLVEDLRAAKVDFFVAPIDSVQTGETVQTLFVAFITAFVSTMLVIQVLSALGMLWMVVFALGVMYDMLTRYADAVGEGWKLTVAEWEAAWETNFGRKQQNQAGAIPVFIDDHDENFGNPYAQPRNRASRSRDPRDDF